MTDNNSKPTKEKPLPPQTIKKGSQISKVDGKKVVKEPKKKNWFVLKLRYIYYRIKESKVYVKLKNKGLPWLGETLVKLAAVGIAAFIILLSLNLFELVDLTIASFIKCIALYYVIAEIKHYLRDVRRGKK